MAEKYKAKGISVDVRIFLNQPKENHSELEKTNWNYLESLLDINPKRAYSLTPTKSPNKS